MTRTQINEVLNAFAMGLACKECPNKDEECQHMNVGGSWADICDMVTCLLLTLGVIEEKDL